MKAVFLCLFVALFGSVYIAAGLQQPKLAGLKNFVLGAETAYVMLQPEPISSSRADRLLWSSDGTEVLVVRTQVSEESLVRDALSGQPSPDLAETSLSVYRLADKRSTLLWHAKSQVASLSLVDWFHGTHRICATITEPLRTVDPTRPKPSRKSIVIFDADKGAATTALSLNQEGGNPDIGVLLSKAKPYGLLVPVSMDAPTVEVGARALAPREGISTLQADGTITRLSVDAGLQWDGWTPEGNPLFMRIDRSSGRQVVLSYEIDPLTGKSLKTVDPRTWKQGQPASEVTTKLLRGTLTGAAKEVNVQSAWLIGSADNSKSMIAPDCSMARLSPKLNAVAYISDGVALVRPILQIPKRAFLAAVVEAQKQEAMQNAKQAGLATLMYSGDYDDMPPGKGTDISDLLGPYAKDKGILDGFVFTYSGGALTGVNDPSKTGLGYVSGPGGRAEVFADGHVEWIPDK